MKRLNNIRKLIGFLLCISISIGLVACRSGSRLKKVYNEVYSEYESIMFERPMTIFSYEDGNELNQKYSKLGVNFTGRVCADYQSYDKAGLTKVAYIMEDIKNRIGIDINNNEFCKANNGYYYGQLFLENGNTCYVYLFESKNSSDMMMLTLNKKNR